MGCILQKGQFACPFRKLRAVLLSDFLGILPGICQKCVHWWKSFNGNSGSVMVASSWSQENEPGHKLLPLKEFKKTVFSSSEFLLMTNVQIFKTSSDWSPLTWVQFRTRIWEILMQTSAQQRPYAATKLQLYVEKITVRGHLFPFPHLPFIIICLQYSTFLCYLSCLLFSYKARSKKCCLQLLFFFHINELWKNISPFFKL